MKPNRIYTLGFRDSDLLHHVNVGAGVPFHVEKRPFGRYRVWFHEPQPEPEPPLLPPQSKDDDLPVWNPPACTSTRRLEARRKRREAFDQARVYTREGGSTAHMLWVLEREMQGLVDELCNDR